MCFPPVTLAGGEDVGVFDLQEMLEFSQMGFGLLSNGRVVVVGRGVLCRFNIGFVRRDSVGHFGWVSLRLGQVGWLAVLRC